MWVVAWIMVGFHTALHAIGMPSDSGWTWALSVVGLVVVIRIVLIPLFVKQIHASRRMQLIQPEMQKIQKKYKGRNDPESRQAMTQETMELYKRTGTNPFSSCLPILLQSPVFFALFRVLNDLTVVATGSHASIGGMTRALAGSAEQSSLFGARLSSSFLHTPEVNVKIVTAVLIVLMSVTTFTTQRQLMRKNMPAAALDNPMAKQQKYLMYLLPVFFAFSGVNFPIGVLIYWLTTNLWSMGQQFYTIRRMPAPGSQAERDLEERRRRQGKEHKRFTIPGLTHTEDSGPEPGLPLVDEQPGKGSGQRPQPKRKSRGKNSGRPPGASGPGRPDGSSSGSGTTNGSGPTSTPGTSKADPSGVARSEPDGGSGDSGAGSAPPGSAGEQPASRNRKRRRRNPGPGGLRPGEDPTAS